MANESEAATEHASQYIKSLDPPTTATEFKALRKDVCVAISEKLCDTPGVALGSYINPEVFQQWYGKLPKDEKKKVEADKVKTSWWNQMRAGD